VHLLHFDACGSAFRKSVLIGDSDARSGSPLAQREQRRHRRRRRRRRRRLSSAAILRDNLNPTSGLRPRRGGRFLSYAFP